MSAVALERRQCEPVVFFPRDVRSPEKCVCVCVVDGARLVALRDGRQPPGTGRSSLPTSTRWACSSSPTWARRAAPTSFSARCPHWGPARFDVHGQSMRLVFRAPGLQHQRQEFSPQQEDRRCGARGEGENSSNRLPTQAGQRGETDSHEFVLVPQFVCRLNNVCEMHDFAS